MGRVSDATAPGYEEGYSSSTHGPCYSVWSLRLLIIQPPVSLRSLLSEIFNLYT